MQREAAEAPDLDAPACGETHRHVVKHHVHRELHVAAGEQGLLVRNALDQLRLRHLSIVPTSRATRSVHPFTGQGRWTLRLPTGWQERPLPLTQAILKTKQRELRAGFPETIGLRVHRSISWIGRAEDATDDDGRFIFLWIAFNAAYADEEEFHNAAPGERAAFAAYFRKVVALDPGQRVYDAIWTNFSGPIRVLLHNRYVFNPFWQHHNGIGGYEDWGERFRASERRFARALRARNTVEVLSLVFDRLYVLRNQLVHGGATWNSRVNRDQVRDGAAILAFLMPVFVNVMMDNPCEDWGRPFYPVVE